MDLRVAAYCRVSTDREDQANSLRSQQSYFTEYIQGHGGWCLAGVYADEGISGTSTRRREAFNRMMGDAEAGALDLILTKEVSRFARNTVDALNHTRRLKALGVGVVFINDGIDTRDNDGELRLTIMASIAQEESRKTSQRVKWGQKRRMEAGVVFGSNSTYGYDTRGGRLYKKEDEAAVIRRVYHKFLSEGKGTHIIARELYEEGIAPPRAVSGKWSGAMIRRILRNEKYVGDLLQKKYITPDYLTHRKVENRGQEEQIYLRDHHEAIIGRADWQAVQEEMSRRAGRQADGGKYSNRYWCSGKIRCGACGSRFVPRVSSRAGGGVYKLWGCHNRVRYGNWKEGGGGEHPGCGMRMVNDKSLTACAGYVLERLGLDLGAAAAEVAADILRLEGRGEADEEPARPRAHRAELECRKERAMDAYLGRTLSREELLEMKAKYDGELERIGTRLDRCAADARARSDRTRSLKELTEAIREMGKGSEEVLGELVEGIEVRQECLLIRIRCLPQTFTLWYSTSGTGEHYRTNIDRCEIS